MTLGQTAPTLVACSAPHMVVAVLDVYLLGSDVSCFEFAEEEARRFGNERLTVLEPPLDPELLAGEHALRDFGSPACPTTELYRSKG